MPWSEKTIACLVVAGFLNIGSAHAVVVLSGGPNNTAPLGQPNFNNIGTLNGASAIYLGNRWVMTAQHVAPSLPSSVHFGGTNYDTVPGSHQQLTNNSQAGLSTFTDIVLFQLTTDPSLPWLDIASASPTVGSTVMMIGNGRTQESSLSYWNVTVNPGVDDDVWNEVSSSDSYNASGFKTSGSQQIQWGENIIETTNLNVDSSGSSSRSVVSYSTLFGGTPPLTEEAQAVLGDSGGAVFTWNGVNTWTLSGMMHAINGYENQPAYTAIAGQSTFAADLSFYRSQILTITQIPEPSISAATILGLCTLLARRKRHTPSRAS